MRISVGLICFLLLGLLNTACVSNQILWTDDVYHMRQAELPEGESLSDETGYANFKERMESSSENSYCESNPYAPIYGYYDAYEPIFWGMYPLNYYPSTTLFFGQGIPGFNPDLSWYGSYGYPYYSSYFNYDPLFSMYGYNPYYYGYGNFNQGFGFFNNGLGLNFNSGYLYSNNQNGNVSGNSGYSNYHEGPRGSLSGYSNSADRLSVSAIKSVENQSNFSSSNRPTVIGNFIISEDTDNRTNGERITTVSPNTFNTNRDNYGYTPKEQRIQFNNGLDYKYNSSGSDYRATYNNSGNNEPRGVNRVVPIQTAPSRIENVQPSRSSGVSRQVVPGRRN